MNTPTKTISKRAIIYCRVSTREQVDEGNSLATQEKYCRDYANKHGFEIAEVFIEQGESAKTADRTELKKLLLFCSSKKNGIAAIIIYKIDRLSRNTDDYSQLRILLKRYGVEIKSTSEHFENTPVGRFMENTIANVAQFDNDVRAERSVGGMRDAMREGRFVWAGPVGYDDVRDCGKKNIAPNAMAPIVYKTFELISKNIYPIEKVRKMMGKEGLVNKKGEPFSHAYFYRMLKNEIYMGWIAQFGERHKGTGTFQPIVSEELFNQVQRVLKNKGWKMTSYKTDNPDFPLRRFVKHPNLGLKLTGSWTLGRHGNRYAFYRFGMKGSNYHRDDFEKKFMVFMEKYSFDKSRIEKLQKFVKAKFTKATEQERQNAHKLRARLEDLTKQQTALVQKNLKGVR